MLDVFFEDKLDKVDNLTKLFMRDVIVQYMDNLTHNNIEFTFGILDIDNFKNINDNYGHLVGDTVLKKVANDLLEKVKDFGVVGRYGGDEFIFVFPKVQEYQDAWNAAFKIRKSTNDLVIDGHADIKLSYTLGISRYPLDAKKLDDLFELADKALYRGKMKGRNCFIIYLAEKHANIDLKSKRDKINSPLYIHSRIYEYIHDSKDLKAGIQNALNYLGSYLMIDHLCIETEDELLYEYVHPISKVKDGFERIGYENIGDMVSNSAIFYENTILTSKLIDSNKLLMKLKSMNIYSNALSEIRVNKKTYGYLRADMVSVDTGRIWQIDDLLSIQFTAMLIGLVMEARGK